LPSFAMTFLTGRALVLLHDTVAFRAFRCATLESGLAKLEGSDLSAE